MRETDLKAIPELHGIPFLDEDHDDARRLTAESLADEIAEAADTLRLFDLLHRDEYQPVAAIRYREREVEFVRVYFRLLDRAS